MKTYKKVGKEKLIFLQNLHSIYCLFRESEAENYRSQSHNKMIFELPFLRKTLITFMRNQ